MVNNWNLHFKTICTCNYCLHGYLWNHRPFHGFFQLLTGTSENPSLKNTSKLVKDAKFECGFLKLTKIKRRKDVCRVGGKFLPQLLRRGGGEIFAPRSPTPPPPPPPHYTKACRISRLLTEISSLSSSVSFFNLVSFLILVTFLQ